ncbi:MAG: transposase [Acidobacteriota bacterium]
MGRDPRYLPRPGSLVEITQRTFQGRFLLRPSERFNALAAGCLAKAQEGTGATLHAVAFLSNHFHLLASFESVEQMSRFMCRLKTSLSIELRSLHGWSGSSFDHRYRSIPISDEPAAQLERLDYLLGQGCKEDLVASPRDWPGVHCVDALLRGQAIEGVWIDRTAFHQSGGRRKELRLCDFEEAVQLELEPLPAFSALSPSEWRGLVEERLLEVEEESRRRREREGTVPAGAGAVLAADPHREGPELVKSPRPRHHAFARAVRNALAEGFREFLRAYRHAARELAAGAVAVQFPENCFPPGLPFVAPSPPEPG